VFADFLEEIETGGPADFAALCAQHPALARDLQRIHVRWQAMTRAFAELSQAAPAPDAAAAASASLAGLMARLAGEGRRIARYAIGAEIARGAMGRVVQAFDEELRREVALKIHRGRGGDGRQQRRFLEEAQIAAQLDHPGIVPIHELGLDAEGRPFFSMRLVRGRDLGEILPLAQRGEDGWSRTRVLHVLLRVCEAMAYAHDKGVVHRDLKPQNVMVGRFGETYVMDWGLARVRRADGGERTATGGDDAEEVDTLRAEIEGEDGGSPLLTRDGDVVGTPAYMAPEQASGNANVADPAVDVYALGAILYHLLAGRMPYAEPGRTVGADALLARVRQGPPEPLHDGVPAELRAICERAMARAPRDRYADVGALAADLLAFLELRVVSAYATGRFTELRKWIARNRALTAATVALVAALAAGVLVATRLWIAADAARERADATACSLAAELDRSAFRSARQSLQLDNSGDAGSQLWRAHLAGRMPRATAWALTELYERDPYLVTLPIHAPDRPVAFAPQADAVLLAGADGRLQVRDAATLALRRELGPTGPVITALAVPAGGPLAVAGTADGAVVVIDVAGGAVLRRVEAHGARVRALTMAPDARAFASGGGDGRVLWWRDTTAEPEPVFELGAAVMSLAIGAGGLHVAAGSTEGTLRVVARDGSGRFDLGFGDVELPALAFDATGAELWVGATDHELRVIRVADGRVVRTERTRNGTCRQLARDRDGSMLIGGWWRTDRAAAAGGLFEPLTLRGVSRFDLDAAARRLVTIGVTSGFGLADVSSHDRRAFGRGSTIALSASGRRVATSAGDRIVVVDAATGADVGRLPPGVAGHLALDPDGRLLAVTTTQPPRATVYDVESGDVRFAVDGPAEIAFAASSCFSPDGEEFATVVGRQHVRRHDSSDGRMLAEHAFVNARLLRIAYASGGRALAAIGRGTNVVRIWSTGDGAVRDVAFGPDPVGSSAATPSAVALSPDAGTVAVGTFQGEIRIRGHDGRTRSIAAHAGTVWSLEFAAADPGLLMSSGGSRGVAFWDLDSDECCCQPVRDEAGQVQLSRDGRTLACVTPAGPILLDLGYRRRHIAGNLEYHLARQREHIELPAGREAGLRRWAADVLAEPWPRWR
jgi:WD40 repeat protein/tRNA A-37 threonylcarbamoyl transferase component Bud32